MSAEMNKERRWGSSPAAARRSPRAPSLATPSAGCWNPCGLMRPSRSACPCSWQETKASATSPGPIPPSPSTDATSNARRWGTEKHGGPVARALVVSDILGGQRRRLSAVLAVTWPGGRGSRASGGRRDRDGSRRDPRDTRVLRKAYRRNERLGRHLQGALRRNQVADHDASPRTRGALCLRFCRGSRVDPIESFAPPAVSLSCRAGQRPSGRAMDALPHLTRTCQQSRRRSSKRCPRRSGWSRSAISGNSWTIGWTLKDEGRTSDCGEGQAEACCYPDRRKSIEGATIER